MRTKQEILQQINQEADKYTELQELQANSSKVAFWKAIKDIVAFAILTLETLFKQHLNEVQTLIKQTEPGTDDWYKELTLKYQDGDTINVQNNLTVYPLEDETKRIIKRVAIKEKTSGGIKIKVAKEGTAGFEALSLEEKTRFSIYINRVKFAGVPVDIISLPADVLNISATIELDSLLYNVDGTKIDGTAPITDSINKYLQEFPFDGAFYLSKLVDAVQDVEGVKDVDITMSKINNVAFSRKIDEVPSGYLVLDEQNTQINYVLA